MRINARLLFVCLLALFPGTARVHAAVKVDAGTFGAIEARSIGPATMSGRISAIDAVASQPRIIYVGAASGGLWKSVNSGTTFKPVFDKYTQSIGAIAVDQNHPDTVWVGTGESDTRNSVSVGTGIYKTMDGGENWQLMGLEKSEHISKIVVDPKNSDTVYVAVPGHLWDSNEDRGLYKTTDGGKTWNKILYVNTDTGCSDVSVDPQEPKILYAAMWQFRRTPDFFTSGGPGSAIHKSTDGGKTWKKLANGLPDGDLGRIAIAVAPSRSSVVYANIEAKKTYIYRSDDMGETWQKQANPFNVQARPFYFSHLVVDPTDYNRVYKPGFNLTVSSDGGNSFKDLAENTHSDQHAFWVNPKDPFQLLVGTDGGVYASLDRGNTWSFRRNLPVSQFYHVSFDMAIPYNVYGGLQDNGSWMGPSQSTNGIENKDWVNVGFGDGFYTWPDPKDNNIVYSEFQGGKMLRYSKSTGELKAIVPYPEEGGPKLRFNWNTPIEISEKNPSAIYIGSQFIDKSTDQGESWQRISPDLTTNNPQWQRQEESGGVTIDNSSAENHCTIFTIGASPLDENLIWAGTDDGNLQLTRDGGKSWSNVIANVPGLPKNTWVSSVEPGRKDPGTAYVTFDGHQTGDMKTYIYKTTDFGKTWTSITSDGLKGFAHVVREDLVNPNLLFAGTEFGLFLSIDGGRQWAQFTGNLPNVAVDDIAIHPRDSDLLLATHGRGIYIVDDITPLRQINDKILDSKVAFLDTAPAVLRFARFSQDFPGDDEYVGRNKPDAVDIVYYMKDRHLFGDLKIEIYDAAGNLVSTMAGGKRKGINRVPWFMRMKAPRTAPSATLSFGPPIGPTVPEGTYTVRLLKGDEKYETKITLAPDPSVPHPDADRKLQQETTMKLYRMQERLAFVADSITDLRDQARDRAAKMKGDALAKNLNSFADRLDTLHKTLVATKEGFLTGEEQLRERVVELYVFVSFYAGKPTDSQVKQTAVLEKEIEKKNGDFESITGKELEGLNSKIKGKKLDPLKLLTKEDWDKRQS